MKGGDLIEEESSQEDNPALKKFPSKVRAPRFDSFDKEAGGIRHQPSQKKKGKMKSGDLIEEESSEEDNPVLKKFPSKVRAPRYGSFDKEAGHGSVRHQPSQKKKGKMKSSDLIEEEISQEDSPTLKKFPSKVRPPQYDSFDKEAGHGGVKHKPSQVANWGRIMKLAFQSIGVVYGDTGTSPLFVLPDIFREGIKHTDDLIGVLSLIFYSVIIIALIKYVFIVLAANDNGDGGTFALYSLICRYAKATLTPNHLNEDSDVSHYQLDSPNTRLKRASYIKSFLEKNKSAKYTLLLVTLISTAMVLGNSILAPCISVLSATEGIKHANKAISNDTIVWISVAILIVVFQVQRFGTDKVGYTFAPVLIIWFISITLIGVYNFLKYDPTVIKALNPMYIITYFARRKKDAWISLGGVVLCLTGSESLFVDLGHFNTKSVRISSCTIVFPAIIVAYFGQASYLRVNGQDVSEIFYKSIPSPFYWPMFVVAVLAAIVSSQALISASFSMVHHSMSFGCFPRVKVVHTSIKHEGQIYVPEINHLLMLACVGVTLGLKNKVKMANAYGIAVALVFLVTSALLVIVMIMIWKTNLIYIILYVVVIGIIELVFLSSVLYKFPDGGYLSLLFGFVLVIIMYIWSYGYRKKYIYDFENKVSARRLAEIASDPSILRVPGVALFYTELVQGVSHIFTDYVQNVPALHSVLVFVSIKSLPIGTVPHEERFLFGRLQPHDLHIYRCIVRYGYNDARVEWDLFEENLIYMLKEFIKEETLMLPSGSVSTEVHGNRQVSTEGGTEEELRKLLGMVDEAVSKGPGILYLLGESEVIASQGSNWLKRFTINYCYNYLTRCVRQSEEIFMIPRKRLLKVAMTYEV